MYIYNNQIMHSITHQLSFSLIFLCFKIVKGACSDYKTHNNHYENDIENHTGKSNHTETPH